jgi:ferredoxin
MKVKVDLSRCEANAICMEHAPEVFKVDDDDNIHILQESPTEDLRPRVDAAVRLCPRHALTIENN